MTDITIQHPFYKLTVLTIVFLSLPNILFLGGWLRFPYNWICVAVLIPILVILFQCRRWQEFDISFDQAVTIRCKTLFLVACIIFPWLLLSGIGGLGLSTGDILCGDSVIKDLVNHPWPLRLVVLPDSLAAAFLNTTIPFHLVYYIGFYLPAGIVGKLFNSFTLACWIEAIYAYFGCILVIAWFLSLTRHVSPFHSQNNSKAIWTRLIFPLFVFMFFKTNNQLFSAIYRSYYPLFYWGNSFTLLYGAPQHTIGAWLAASLCLACYLHIIPLIHCSLGLACCCLITPFALIGCIFLWILATIEYCKTKRNIMINFALHIITFIVLFLPAALYITSNTFSFPCHFVFSNSAFSWNLYFYGLFVSIAIPIVLIIPFFFCCDQRSCIFLGGVFITLLCSTLLNIGFCNDFPIRSSASALFLLEVFLGATLALPTSRYITIIRLFILFFCLISITTYFFYIWKYRSSLGFPPSDNIISFIEFPEKGTILQRNGNPDSFFFRFLAAHP